MRTAASIKLINTRLPSTDPVWGISDDRRANENTYGLQPRTSPSTAAPNARSLGGTEKQMGYSTWRTQRIPAPDDAQAYRVDSPLVYHAGGYAGVPMHDGAKQYYQERPHLAGEVERGTGA